jgi:hypothetical protein
VKLQQRNPTEIKWRTLVAVAIIAVGAAFFTDTYWPQIAQALTLATTHQPERLTELYFAVPEQLITNAKPGQKLPVSFAVHNLEAQDMIYAYRITLTDDHGTTSLGNQHLPLLSGQTRTTSQIITVPPGQGKLQISIELPQQSQAIHFWIDRG